MMDVRHHDSGAPDEWLHRADAIIWRRIYPGHGSHVRAARKLPALLLQGTGLSDDAEWTAGELVSNAIKYTRSGEHGGWFGVEVGLGRSSAWVAVRDLGGPFVPSLMTPASTGELAEHGRGLYTVANLAARLDVTGTPQAGHTICAVFDLAGAENIIHAGESPCDW